jgi:hypothetical protein
MCYSHTVTGTFWVSSVTAKYFWIFSTTNRYINYFLEQEEKYSEPLLIWLQPIYMSDNPDQNIKMTNCVHSWVHILRYVAYKGKRD